MSPVVLLVTVSSCLMATAPLLTESASIGAIARNIHSDVIILDGHLNAATPNIPRNGRRINLDRFPIPSGGAVDLFYRYGFFSLSVRVVPRDDPSSWLVREPTSDVFDPASVSMAKNFGPNSFASEPFQILLCDDIEELKEGYFKSFTAEGVVQPYKLYTGSWRTPTMAKYLGISIDALDGDSAFVLLKLTKNSGTISVDDRRLALSPSAAATAKAVRVGDEKSVLDFVMRHGSHYIRSVTVGDAIYQVLALTKPQMEALKSAVGGRKTLDVADWATVYDSHLAPWKVRETGNIRAASGDVRLQRFVEEELRLVGQFGSYANLVGSLLDNPSKVATLEELSRDSMAIVGVDFASMNRFVGEALQSRQYYDEIITTHTALWEANL